MGGWLHTPKTWGSEPLLSSDLNDELADFSAGVQSAWDTYTPTRRNGVGGSALSIGNGTIAGRYIQIGATVKFQIDMVLGSTTALGPAGDKWTLTLPIEPADYATGVGVVYDDTGSDRRPIVWDRANLTTDEVVMSIYNQNYVDFDTPIAWAASDRLSISGCYEV